jgi:Ran GTPase-activating protein (RanGAP) involved in mRNA processing and transport
MLTVNSVLTKLALDENGIGDAGLTHIANALCQNTALVKLSMNSNCVREAGVLALGAACSRQCALRSISLLENSLTPLAVSELARAVAGNTVLAALQLSWCVVSAHEVGALRHWHATSQANSTLESLSLLRTPLLPSQCLDRGSALLDKHALTALNLNHCSLQPPDMPYVARFLADNAVLLTLDVSENNMLDAGASELASALRQNTKLRTLALRDNDVTAPGLQSIFDAVPLPVLAIACPVLLC